MLVGNGIEALAAFTASTAPPFVLVLMDVQMPFMNGIECTRRLRSWEHSAGRAPVKVLALSANGIDAACQRDCMAVGMNGVLNKPIEKHTLVTHLSPFACSPKSPSLGTPRRDDVQAAEGEKLPSVAFDYVAVVKRHEGDVKSVRKMVRHFSAKGTLRVEAIEAAAARDDVPAIKSEAHTLKGLCAYVGAVTLQATALQLDRAARDAIVHNSPFDATPFLARLRSDLKEVLEAHRRFLDSTSD